MASYKIVNADQLDADLVAVADSIRAKGKTTGSLSFPAGFQKAVSDISTGVNVQAKTGTVKSGQTINCGFKPDLVALRNTEESADGWYHPAFAFTAMNMETMLAQAEIKDGFYFFSATQTTTGFKCNYVNFYDFDWNWSGSNYTGSFNYTAVKYT